jgi:hypothetical protein
MRGLRIIAGFLLAALAGASAQESGSPLRRVDRPEPVIAAYLVNFARHVVWPPGPDDAPLRLAVFGSDTFEGTLSQAAAGRTAGGRPIEVQLVGSLEEALSAHVVFLAPGAPEDAPAALARHGGGRLTVGLGPGFLDRGGMVELVLREGRMTFAVDLRRAEAAGLAISARMLTAAVEVRR